MTHSNGPASARGRPDVRALSQRTDWERREGGERSWRTATPALTAASPPAAARAYFHRQSSPARGGQTDVGERPPGPTGAGVAEAGSEFAGAVRDRKRSEMTNPSTAPLTNAITCVCTSR